jgi:5-methylcytosine-specific restriction endonuclease McrA
VCADCGTTERSRGTEIHHVEPLPTVGLFKANYHFNCGNHQTNLVLLCKPCHGRRHHELNAAKKRGAEPVRQGEMLMADGG